jgi:hypothetical protein
MVPKPRRGGARPRASANSSLGNLIACFRGEGKIALSEFQVQIEQPQRIEQGQEVSHEVVGRRLRRPHRSLTNAIESVERI